MKPSCANREQKSSSQPDRWHLLLLGLQGQPWPELPPLPGRLVVARDEPLADHERAALLASDEPDADVGRVLGVTRQLVSLLRRRLRGIDQGSP